MDIPEHLKPVEVVTPDTPREEPASPSSSSTTESIVNWVRNLLEVWRHNRGIYPGWLVAPSGIRSQLSEKIRKWEPRILQVFPDLTPVERLHVVHELVWYREILLEPLLTELESAAEEALKSIDCQSRTIDGTTNPEIGWTTVREEWRFVALVLVTMARHRFDRGAFDQRIEALSPFLQDHPDIDHRIRHECCLWAVYSMDFETLDDLLKDWQPENCDPVWMMRKAALLSEMGHGDEALALARPRAHNHPRNACRRPQLSASIAGGVGAVFDSRIRRFAGSFQKVE